MFAEINHFRPYGGSSANWPHCHQQWTACGGHYPGPHPNPPPPKRYILAVWPHTPAHIHQNRAAFHIACSSSPSRPPR
ncbi:hypothetical protein M8J76_000022 [Diaphorina citri]|nr:hypothetical protein M8J76_000022 [Diaphorina citri]